MTKKTQALFGTLSERCPESAVAAAVERYLHDVGGSATIRQIRRALPRYLSLSLADRVKSVTRLGEEVWEQQVRNIVCHRNTVGNAVNAGRFIYTSRRLTLSDSPQGDLFTRKSPNNKTTH